MKNLTLVIPAKQEEDSLPIVLNEVADLDCKKFVVLHSTDFKTLEAIKNFDCKIIYQNNKGYGSAIIEGIENTQTEYVCIFNADGSFDPKYLKDMLALCKNYDFIFMSRYLNEGASDDDTLLTKIGNYTFTLLAKVFFSLKLSDVLFTYILGKTKSFQSLDLKRNDFSLCVEIPVKAERMKFLYKDLPSHERKRIAGFKKVNEFRDGFKILIYMMKLFFKIK